MCVLSNNSPKKFSFYEAKKSVPDRVIRILSVLEDLIKPFCVKLELQENSTRITIQDKKNTVQGEPLRVIYLDIFKKPKSYSLNLYHRSEGSKDQKRVYEIKVKGDYELKKLKTNLEKLIRGKNLIHRPRSYP